MVDVQKLEEMVQGLTPKDLSQFREWFVNFDASRWDQQLTEDIANGKLDELANEAISEERSGKTKSL